MPNYTKYELAKTLYFYTEKSGEEIATQIGTTPKTVSNWANGKGPGKYKGEDWKALKRARSLSADQQVANYYKMLENLNAMIFRQREVKEDGTVIEGRGGIPNSKDTDTIKKLTASIRDLQDVGLKEYVLSLEHFVAYISQRDLELSQSIVDYMIEFLNEKAEEMEAKP